MPEDDRTNRDDPVRELSELQQQLARLKAAVDQIGEAREAARTAVEVAGRVGEASDRVTGRLDVASKELNEVAGTITALDLPKRFGDLDTTLRSATLGLQTLQSELGSMRGDLRARVDGIQESVKAASTGLGDVIGELAGHVVKQLTAVESALKRTGNEAAATRVLCRWLLGLVVTLVALVIALLTRTWR